LSRAVDDDLPAEEFLMTRLAEQPRVQADLPPDEPTSVLDRILVILDSVKESDGSISITELSARTRMPKSTVSRLAAALVEQRYLERTQIGVALGLRLFELGTRASVPRRRPAAAAPIIRDLWDLTGERIGLWVHSDAEMVSISAVPGRLPMLSTKAGTRSPVLTTASGKAFLAFCDDEAVVDRISAPLVDDAAAQFRSELNQVRQSSIAVDAGVSYPGILAFASPVLSAKGAVIGALSIAGPHGSMDSERVAPLVREAGADLSRRFAAA
jgi:IclR family acetate operon transcriptional repressor